MQRLSWEELPEIDPTNDDNSAYPLDIDGVPSFNLQRARDETVSIIRINEITTRHLMRLRGFASDLLGPRVIGLMITPSTHFLDTGRKPLRLGPRLGGLEVLPIIHEPVAAVLAHTARQTPKEQGADENILVADPGSVRGHAVVVDLGVWVLRSCYRS